MKTHHSRVKAKQARVREQLLADMAQAYSDPTWDEYDDWVSSHTMWTDKDIYWWYDC